MAMHQVRKQMDIELDTADNDLNFKYNGTTVFKLSSAGAVVAAETSQLSGHLNMAIQHLCCVS